MANPSRIALTAIVIGMVGAIVLISCAHNGEPEPIEIPPAVASERR